MKKIIFLLLSLCYFSNTLLAQAPKLSTKKGTNYGEKITANDAVSPDDVTTLLKNKESIEVKIKGTVVDVCEAKGCFLYLKTTKGKIYIKTKDDSFFVPVSLKGKTVIVKGTASTDSESKEISIQAIGVLVI